MGKIMFLMILCLGLTGCASNLMQPIADESLPQIVQEDQAAVIFFRPSAFGGAVQAPVIEAVAGKPQLVGIVSSGFKVLYLTTPGTHYFVVGGEASSLLEARLDGGKFYYVEVEPRFGVFKARFALVPITDKELGSSNFKTNMGYCKWVNSKPEAEVWFKDNLPSLQSKFNESMKDHEQTVEESRNVLLPQYGSEQFYK